MAFNYSYSMLNKFWD